MSKPEQDPKIIVSYRRTDFAFAGRIFDRLVQRFGKKSLFIDIDNIPFGGDFRKHIDEALKSSDILIALVGPRWAGGEGKDSKITRAADPVRVEIETALRQEVPILPVLLDDARMPDPTELPDSIRDFAYRNAADVESGRDFDVHMDRLIKAIEQILGPKAVPAGAPGSIMRPAALVSTQPSAKRKPWLLIAGLLALLIAAGIGAALLLAPEKLAIAEPKDASTGTAYCADLKRVVSAARENFVPILGPQNGGTWTARIQLPGWDSCGVQDWTYKEKTTRYFSCQRPSFTSFDEIHAKRDAADAYLVPCLGTDWVRQRSQYSDQTTDTTFLMGQDDPIVRIRESFYKDTGEYVLRLDVDAPQSAAKSVPGASGQSKASN